VSANTIGSSGEGVFIVKIELLQAIKQDIPDEVVGAKNTRAKDSLNQEYKFISPRFKSMKGPIGDTFYNY
jgi:hypothetical protein